MYFVFYFCSIVIRKSSRFERSNRKDPRTTDPTTFDRSLVRGLAQQPAPPPAPPRVSTRRVPTKRRPWTPAQARHRPPTRGRPAARPTGTGKGRGPWVRALPVLPNWKVQMIYYVFALVIHCSGPHFALNCSTLSFDLAKCISFSASSLRLLKK